MALQKFGQEQHRDSSFLIGYSSRWWAELNRDEWVDLVILAVDRAERLFSAIEEPSIPERRMKHQLETLLTNMLEDSAFRGP